jgi:preprotein translocase subunit SecD
MILYYRLPGFIACLALGIYGVVILAIFKLIPITLTLPALAGFIVSLGMAVDANVLIFERMKEELRGGRSLAAAVEAGFNRAWTAIRDSNITTFIACAVLFWLGGSLGAMMVRGFAITLFIGVAMSMFSAITVTRTLLRFIPKSRLTTSPTAYGVKL